MRISVIYLSMHPTEFTNALISMQESLTPLKIRSVRCKPPLSIGPYSGMNEANEPRGSTPFTCAAEKVTAFEISENAGGSGV